MPTPTYTPLANTTLTGSSATVTFSSINQSYRDIIATANVKGADGEKIRVSVNSVGSYLYGGIVMEANGSSYTSSAGDDGYVLIGRSYSPMRSDNFSVVTLNFMDYSQTNKHKSILYRTSNSLQGVFAGAYRAQTNTAVSSIIFQLEGGSFAAGSTFAIYGVTA